MNAPTAAEIQAAQLDLGICQAANAGTPAEATCTATQAPAAAAPAVAAAPAPSPLELAQQAEAQLQLAAPPLQLSPATNVPQIVNAPTWAWVAPADFSPLHATAAAGPVTVTATATPEAINITYADGGTTKNTSCATAGTPYSDALANQEDPDYPLSAASPTCGWTFHDPATSDPVTATISYAVTWAVTGAAGGGDLGALASPPAVYDLRVDQIHILNTP